MSSEVSNYPLIERLSDTIHLCLICNTKCMTTENIPSNACEHVREKHWRVTSVYDDFSIGNKNKVEAL